MRLKNYQAAMNSLEKISTRDDRLKAAYQKVAYYRGIELFRNKNYQEAMATFTKSLMYKEMNPELRARALYWRGESNYRLGKADAAAGDWEAFRQLPAAKTLPEYGLIDYNLGYLWYNERDYSKALTFFLAFNNGTDRNRRDDMVADANNRIADCYYIRADYPSAIVYYNKVIDYAKVDADYAMFQKGFAQGLSNNKPGKDSHPHRADQ